MYRTTTPTFCLAVVLRTHTSSATRGLFGRRAFQLFVLLIFCFGLSSQGQAHKHTNAKYAKKSSWSGGGGSSEPRDLPAAYPVAYLDAQAKMPSSATAPPIGDSGKKAVSPPVGEQPSINTDMPYKVNPGRPFKIDVMIDGTSERDHATRTVYMEQTEAIQYTPRVLHIKPGERATTKAKILISDAGLAQVEITGNGVDQFDATVDAGFHARLKIQTDQSFDSRGVYGATIKFANQQDIAIALDAPITLTLRATNALLREPANDDGKPETHEMQPELTFQLGAGSTSTSLFEIKPTSFTGRPIGLAATVKINKGYPGIERVVSNESLTIPVKPVWWYVLGLAMLGGIVASVYRITAALSNNAPEKSFAVRCIFRVMGGALAGAGAYLLADLDVIGVKLDTSSPRTFCILGFLVAYIGLDVIMGKFSSPRQEGGKPKEVVTESHEPQMAPKTVIAA